MTNPIVPEEKPIKQHYDDLYNGYDTGFNTCRQTVLNNLKSKETRENLSVIIAKKLLRFASYIDEHGVVEWEDGTKVKYIGLPSLAPDLTEAIIKELTRGK